MFRVRREHVVVGCKGLGCLRASHCLRYYVFLLNSWRGDAEKIELSEDFFCDKVQRDMFENFAPSPFPVMNVPEEPEPEKYEFNNPFAQEIIGEFMKEEENEEK